MSGAKPAYEPEGYKSSLNEKWFRPRCEPVDQRCEAQPYNGTDHSFGKPTIHIY